MDNYLVTFFHQIENVDRFAHKISADIIVFVRWLDAQPRGDKFDKIWQETKKFRLEPFYTSFYDENLGDKFRSRIHFLGELFDGIKSVLIKCRNLGIEKKLRQEWVGMEKRALKENLRWMASDARGNAVMPKWIMKLHAKTLQKLAFGSAEKGNEKTGVLAKQFKKKLKTGLCQSLHAKHRLLNFLEIEDIKEIFEKLEIEFKVKDFEDDPMDVDEQTNCSDQTEKQKSKNKKKKNKNRKKKSGKGKESVQSEESEREKMQRLEQIEVKPIEEQTKTETKKPEDLSRSNKTIETRVKSELDSDQQMFLAQPLKNGVDQTPEFNENVEYDLLSIMKEPLGGMTKITIRDLKEDNFLLGKYLELMADPNKFCTNTVDGILVELSVFANEIWRRIESIGHFQQNANKLGNFLFPKKMVEIWSKLESEGQVEKDKTKMRKFGLILFRILKVVVIGGSVNNNDQSMPSSQHNPTSDRNKIMNVNNDLDKVGNMANDRNVIKNGRDIHKTDKMKNESNDRNVINEIIGIREQLHRNNFARLISSNETARNAWSSLTKDGQFYAITVLLGGRRKDGKKYGNARAQFLKYLAKWEKTRAQLELDKQLFSQFNNFSKYSRQILGNFVENMQQIKFNIQTDLETNSLINILRENGFYALEKLKENQIGEEFGKIKAIVTKWSAGTGILLLSGSTMLKAQTADSDIDTICIVPGHIHSDSFFGTLQCLGANERHNCDDNSLFCMLCQLPEVHSLRRLPETLVPLIRLISSFGHNFEIVFASIPDIHKISMTEVNGSRERICEMTHKLATKVKEGNLKEGEIVKTERMVRSLAAYHSNLMIAEMVPNIETFRIFVLTLKMWAKNNFIYNNVLGFLHGMPLYVLAAKICIMYPNANVPFLLERFFLTYSLWEWPLPVQLAEVRPDLLAWSAEKEQEKRIFLFGVGLYSQLSMPIITPGYPAHNSTFNVNWFTAKIIQKAMQEAFEQLQGSSANGTKWEKLLLKRRTFSDMYEHSFAINCAASSWDLCEEFCGFVGTRIRVQLMKSVECVRGEVNFCHARSVDGCPEHILHRYKARSHKASCKAWLVGIDLKRSVLPDGNEAAPPMSSKSKAQTDQNLKLDIVEPIVDSYRRVVLGELRWAGVGDHQQTNQQRPPLFLEAKKIKIKKFFEKTKNFESWQETELGTDFVHLESKYVEREELRERWRE